MGYNESCHFHPVTKPFAAMTAKRITTNEQKTSFVGYSEAELGRAEVSMSLFSSFRRRMRTLLGNVENTTQKSQAPHYAWTTNTK